MVTERLDADLWRLDVDHLALDPVAYATTLERLAGLLVADHTLTQLLEHVLELTSRAIGASAAVSVTVVDDEGRHATAAATSIDAREVDDAQYAYDEGPCVEALRTGQEHRFDDLTELERWPRFRDRALALGFGSVLAVPLRAGAETVGCLNVFAAEPRGLSEDDRVLARRIAAPAAAALANARAHVRVHRLAEQLQGALEVRAVIERAKGVLIARHGGTEESAAEDLRRRAEQHGGTLVDAARSVLAGLETGGAGSVAFEGDVKSR